MQRIPHVCYISRIVPHSERFTLVAEFEPKGDQPQAIAQLTDGVRRGLAQQVLLGVTGSGKTFTVANVEFTADKAGIFPINCQLHPAHVGGELVVLE